jgi:DNA-binding transcriptional LysR family regulator
VVGRSFAEADRIEKLMRRAGTGEVGRLTIGFVGTASDATLPTNLRAFRGRFPHVELRLEELTTGPQVAGLHARRIDVGLVRPPVEDPSLELTPLVEEQLVAALPDSHPLAALATVPVEALASEPFILFVREHGTGLYDDILAVCREAGFRPTRRRSRPGLSRIRRRARPRLDRHLPAPARRLSAAKGPTQASRSHSPGCATTANHSSNIFNGSQPRYGGTEAR